MSSKHALLQGDPMFECQYCKNKFKKTDTMLIPYKGGIYHEKCYKHFLADFVNYNEILGNDDDDKRDSRNKYR